MRAGGWLNRFFFLFWFSLFSSIISCLPQRIFTIMPKTSGTVKRNVSLIKGKKRVSVSPLTWTIGGGIAISL